MVPKWIKENVLNRMFGESSKMLAESKKRLKMGDKKLESIEFLPEPEANALTVDPNVLNNTYRVKLEGRLWEFDSGPDDSLNVFGAGFWASNTMSNTNGVRVGRIDKDTINRVYYRAKEGSFQWNDRVLFEIPRIDLRTSVTGYDRWFMQFAAPELMQMHNNGISAAMTVRAARLSALLDQLCAKRPLTDNTLEDRIQRINEALMTESVKTSDGYRQALNTAEIQLLKELHSRSEYESLKGVYAEYLTVKASPMSDMERHFSARAIEVKNAKQSAFDGFFEAGYEKKIHFHPKLSGATGLYYVFSKELNGKSYILNMFSSYARFSTGMGMYGLLTAKDHCDVCCIVNQSNNPKAFELVEKKIDIGDIVEVTWSITMTGQGGGNRFMPAGINMPAVSIAVTNLQLVGAVPKLDDKTFLLYSNVKKGFTPPASAKPRPTRVLNIDA
jgi:hypothetical protein